MYSPTRSLRAFRLYPFPSTGWDAIRYMITIHVSVRKETTLELSYYIMVIETFDCRPL